MQRRIVPFILEDLRSKKMVFIGGPRQVGKTTLSIDIMKHFKKPIYLNFDHPEDRIHIQRNWKKKMIYLYLMKYISGKIGSLG